MLERLPSRLRPTYDPVCAKCKLAMKGSTSFRDLMCSVVTSSNAASVETAKPYFAKEKRHGEIIYRENLALLRKRLAEAKDEATRKIIQKLLEEEEAKISRLQENEPQRHRVHACPGRAGYVAVPIPDWRNRHNREDQNEAQGLGRSESSNGRIDRELKRLRDLNHEQTENTGLSDSRLILGAAPQYPFGKNRMSASRHLDRSSRSTRTARIVRDGACRDPMSSYQNERPSLAT